MTREPFIAHSELTNEIYIVVGIVEQRWLTQIKICRRRYDGASNIERKRE